MLSVSLIVERFIIELATLICKSIFFFVKLPFFLFSGYLLPDDPWNPTIAKESRKAFTNGNIAGRAKREPQFAKFGFGSDVGLPKCHFTKKGCN